MSKNVFVDLGFSEEEAAGLQLRSYLFMSLQQIVRKSGLTQAKVAELIGADQPKVSKILNGNLSEFSVERITLYLQRLAYDIHISTIPCSRGRKSGRVVMEDPEIEERAAPKGLVQHRKARSSKTVKARKKIG